MGTAQSANPLAAPHIPVLIDEIVEKASPVCGDWLDGTFGAGGYARALFAAGANRIVGIDQDPEVLERASKWLSEYAGRLVVVEGCFADLVTLAGEHNALPLDGIVLDIGVSSMQIDQAKRGFSFMQDGPLDMRMSQSGVSAADVVNQQSEEVIADILFHLGEERASRRIARNIVKSRKQQPFETTGQLCEVIERSLPRPKPGQSHPATRSFQALRIAVNDELGQLVKGLSAAEQALRPGGTLAVVTFHSLEDRIVKRFIQNRSGMRANASRYAPQQVLDAPRFENLSRKAIEPSAREISMNPRARSAKLRVARRLEAPAGEISGKDLGLPGFDLSRILV